MQKQNPNQDHPITPRQFHHCSTTKLPSQAKPSQACQALTGIVVGHVPGFGRNAHDDGNVVLVVHLHVLQRPASEGSGLEQPERLSLTSGALVQPELLGQIPDHGGLVLGPGLEDVGGGTDVDVVRVREEFSTGFGCGGRGGRGRGGGGRVVVRCAQILEPETAGVGGGGGGGGVVDAGGLVGSDVDHGAGAAGIGVVVVVVVIAAHDGADGAVPAVLLGLLLLQAQLVQHDGLVEGAVGVAAVDVLHPAGVGHRGGRAGSGGAGSGTGIVLGRRCGFSKDGRTVGQYGRAVEGIAVSVDHGQLHADVLQVALWVVVEVLGGRPSSSSVGVVGVVIARIGMLLRGEVLLLRRLGHVCFSGYLLGFE